MVVFKFLFFHFTHEFYGSCKLYVTELCTSFKKGTKNLVFLVEGKIVNVGCLNLSLEAEFINFIKLIIKYPDYVRASLKHIIFGLFSEIYNFFDRVISPSIDYFSNFVLIGNFRVGRWDDLILLKVLIFVIGFFYPANVLNDVLSELRPFEMPISIDVNGLKELNEVRYKVVFWQLVLWNVEFFHEVDKSGQFKALCVELELFL